MIYMVYTLIRIMFHKGKALLEHFIYINYYFLYTF